MQRPGASRERRRGLGAPRGVNPVPGWNGCASAPSATKATTRAATCADHQSGC